MYSGPVGRSQVFLGIFGETAMVCLFDKWQGFPKHLVKIGRWSPSLSYGTLKGAGTGHNGWVQEEEVREAQSPVCDMVK